jgi:hypothetical protein
MVQTIRGQKGEVLCGPEGTTGSRGGGYCSLPCHLTPVNTIIVEHTVEHTAPYPVT